MQYLPSRPASGCRDAALPELTQDRNIAEFRNQYTRIDLIRQITRQSRIPDRGLRNDEA